MPVAKKDKFHTCGGPRRRPCLGEGRGRRITLECDFAGECCDLFLIHKRPNSFEMPASHEARVIFVQGPSYVTCSFTRPIKHALPGLTPRVSKQKRLPLPSDSCFTAQGLHVKIVSRRHQLKFIIRNFSRRHHRCLIGTQIFSNIWVSP